MRDETKLEKIKSEPTEEPLTGGEEFTLAVLLSEEIEGSPRSKKEVFESIFRKILGEEHIDWKKASDEGYEEYLAEAYKKYGYLETGSDID